MGFVRLFSPRGRRIEATYELVPGAANVIYFKRTGKDLEPEYEGSTDIDWDSQKTITDTVHGRRLQDSKGTLWWEDECSIEPVRCVVCLTPETEATAHGIQCSICEREVCSDCDRRKHEAKCKNIPRCHTCGTQESKNGPPIKVCSECKELTCMSPTCRTSKSNGEPICTDCSCEKSDVEFVDDVLTKPSEDDIRDWKYEVSNNDTVLGLRDWIEHRDEADGK